MLLVPIADGEKKKAQGFCGDTIQYLPLNSNRMCTNAMDEFDLSSKQIHTAKRDPLLIERGRNETHVLDSFVVPMCLRLFYGNIGFHYYQYAHRVS
jgi:hypothetical protein